MAIGEIADLMNNVSAYVSKIRGINSNTRLVVNELTDVFWRVILYARLAAGQRHVRHPRLVHDNFLVEPRISNVVVEVFRSATRCLHPSHNGM